MKLRLLAAAAWAAAFAISPAFAQTKTIRAVMHSDLKVLDPIWTTANIVRNHGYMVWDTLFTMDEKMQIRPALAASYEVMSPTKVRFKLRPGVKFHDGTPLNAAAVKFTFERALRGKSVENAQDRRAGRSSSPGGPRR